MREGGIMPHMTKSQKKHLQELSNRCQELELSKALEALAENFRRWKNNELTVWDLNEKIHQYHDGKALELYNTYELLNDPRVAVAKAVSQGIINIEDVQENCRPLLDTLIEFYNSNV
jgi:hypothetical protein